MRQLESSKDLCPNLPLPGDLNDSDSQDLFVGGFFVRNNTLNFTATGVAVQSNGPTN
jgi:hypothetical protein